MKQVNNNDDNKPWKPLYKVLATNPASSVEQEFEAIEKAEKAYLALKATESFKTVEIIVLADGSNVTVGH